MAENLQGDGAAVVTEQTCGICLEDSKDPLNLPCGHSFCDGCLGEWRSRYGVTEEMRTKCPICRARIPPSKEMVASLLTFRANKQNMEDNNDTSSEFYRDTCEGLEKAQEIIGPDWDGVTVLEVNEDKQAVVIPDYIFKALGGGDIKSVLRWINANRTEDRANAVYTKSFAVSVLMLASTFNRLVLMSLLLQLGANVDFRESGGGTAISSILNGPAMAERDFNERVRLLLSWGATFFPDGGCSRGESISVATAFGQHALAKLMESELGGRRCEIISPSRTELNGKTCVADEYLPDSNQYKVMLETKTKEVLVIHADNLKRRDRTPQDCGYYIEFKNGRTVRHDFDSSEDCQAFVAALNSKDETQPIVTEEAEARADQAAADLLAELGLDDSRIEFSSGCMANKSKKKKGGKKKKK